MAERRLQEVMQRRDGVVVVVGEAFKDTAGNKRRKVKQ